MASPRKLKNDQRRSAAAEQTSEAEPDPLALPERPQDAVLQTFRSLGVMEDVLRRVPGHLRVIERRYISMLDTDVDDELCERHTFEFGYVTDVLAHLSMCNELLNDVATGRAYRRRLADDNSREMVSSTTTPHTSADAHFNVPVVQDGVDDWSTRWYERHLGITLRGRDEARRQRQRSALANPDDFADEDSKTPEMDPATTNPSRRRSRSPVRAPPESTTSSPQPTTSDPFEMFRADFFDGVYCPRQWISDPAPPAHADYNAQDDDASISDDAV